MDALLLSMADMHTSSTHFSEFVLSLLLTKSGKSISLTKNYLKWIPFNGSYIRIESLSSISIKCCKNSENAE